LLEFENHRNFMSKNRSETMPIEQIIVGILFAGESHQVEKTYGAYLIWTNADCKFVCFIYSMPHCAAFLPFHVPNV
jgi:hypothetical protein